MFIAPLDEIFAGFSAQKTDPAFFDPLRSAISFIGLLVSVAAIPLSFLPMVLERRKNNVGTDMGAEPRRFALAKVEVA